MIKAEQAILDAEAELEELEELWTKKVNEMLE